MAKAERTNDWEPKLQLQPTKWRGTAELSKVPSRKRRVVKEAMHTHTKCTERRKTLKWSIIREAVETQTAAARFASVSCCCCCSNINSNNGSRAQRHAGSRRARKEDFHGQLVLPCCIRLLTKIDCVYSKLCISDTRMGTLFFCALP